MGQGRGVTLALSFSFLIVLLIWMGKQNRKIFYPLFRCPQAGRAQTFWLQPQKVSKKGRR